MTVRLFIGTTLSRDLILRIRAVAGEHLIDPVWKVAPEEQWHITALFIGERTEKDLPSLTADVERLAATTKAIQLHNGRLLTMPAGAPRMLWIAFDVEPALTTLHLQLARAVGATPSQHVPYRPHITLARSKGIGPSAHGSITIPMMPLDHLTLFRTEPRPEGSLHHALCTWRLN